MPGGSCQKGWDADEQLLLKWKSSFNRPNKRRQLGACQCAADAPEGDSVCGRSGCVVPEEGRLTRTNRIGSGLTVGRDRFRP